MICGLSTAEVISYNSLSFPLSWEQQLKNWLLRVRRSIDVAEMGCSRFERACSVSSQGVTRRTQTKERKLLCQVRKTGVGL